MHHRLSKREAVEIEIDLYHKDRRLKGYRTRDISRDGMFVKTDGESLPKHAAVAVELRSVAGQSRSTLRIPAIVSHTNNEGVGLMFSRPHHYDLLKSLFNN